MLKVLSGMFDVSLKKGAAGCLLALGTLILLSSYDGIQFGNRLYFPGFVMGLLLAMAFTTAGFLRVRGKNRRVRQLWNAIWGGVFCLCSTLLSLLAVDVTAVWYYPAAFVHNGLVMLSLILLLYLFTDKWRLSVTAVNLLCILLSVVNSFVWRFRGKELLFSDFMSIGTAINVVQAYEFQITAGLALGVALILLIWFCQFSLPEMPRMHGIGERVCVGVLLLVVAGVCVMRFNDKKLKSWDREGSQTGIMFNMLVSVRESLVDEPEDYSPMLVSEYEQMYLDTAFVPEKLPNIVVVVDEAFADLRVFGGDVQANREITPFIDSLKENTIRGYALTSIFGGNTANSEFEFLTSTWMAFLPEGAVPFQQFINQDTFSLAWLLKSWGYRCIATHPYHASGWSRPSVYPRLGFDELIFEEAYQEAEKMRKYVSDGATVDYLINRLRQAGSEPTFLYCMTMQNHSPFSYEGENYEQTLMLTDGTGEYPLAEQYLQLLTATDKAVEKLLTYLMDAPRDTIVLFFGDHMPRIEDEYYEMLLGGHFETLDQQMLKYQVPFFIWANYDIPDKEVSCTSLSYLAPYLLEAAGMDLPPYYQFLKDMERMVPSISAAGYYSIAQGGYADLSSADNEEAEWISMANVMMYNAVFDRKHTSEHFFNRYIGK